MKEVSAAYRDYLQAALSYQFCCTHGKLTSLSLNSGAGWDAYARTLAVLLRLDQAASTSPYRWTRQEPTGYPPMLDRILKIKYNS